eukprot:gene869-501_t
MYVGDAGTVYVERSHPAYPYVIDFLVSCCEPISRTHHIEQYAMSSSSLSAASAEGTYSLDMIRSFLRYWQFKVTDGPRRELVLDLDRVRVLHALAQQSPSASSFAPHSTPAATEPNRKEEEEEDSDTFWARLASPEWNTYDRSWQEHRAALEGWWRRQQSRLLKKEAIKSTTRSDAAPVGAAEPTPAQRPSSPRRYSLVALRASVESASTNSTTAIPPSVSPSSSVLPKGGVQPITAASALAEALLASAAGTGSSAASSSFAFLPRIPPAVEAMLTEEEGATKVEIVLQPKLRRFHNFHTAALSALGAGQQRGQREASDLTPPPPPSSTSTAESGDALAHFLITRDRELLEEIVKSVQQWMEPVTLGGAATYVVSDVNRHALAAAAAAKQGNGLPGGAGVGMAVEAEGGETTQDAARLRVLKRLYVPPPPRTGVQGGASAAPGGGGGAQLEYRSQVRRGCLREVREALFKRFGIRTDCCYDYLNDPSEGGGEAYSSPPRRTTIRTGNTSANTPQHPPACPAVVGFHVDRLELSSGTHLRPYQVTSLDRFRRGQLAHQGVVVLPCGAGKTLTGIAAAATLKKRTIVMCVNHMSVFQWQREFLRWTNLQPHEVTVCTAKVKQMPGPVFITTYSMLVAKRPQRGQGGPGAGAAAARGAEAQRSEEILAAIQRETWGLLLLDEVHTALAHHFQEVLNKIQYKCVLGLSATLLREDDRIADLRHLVGPKLYEANWLDLTRAGYLAKVECAEIQCPLPLPYWDAYTAVTGGAPDVELVMANLAITAAASGGATPAAAAAAAAGVKLRRAAATPLKRPRRRRRFSQSDSSSDSWESSASDEGSDTANTNKNSNTGGQERTRGARRARRRRGRRRRGFGGGHHMGPAQTIASCNPVKLWCAQALLHFHLKERHPPDKVIQATSEMERRHLLQWFQFSNEVNAIILTRVGDVALDIPNASVVIQISGLGASRRQEAQRLGRILRPKPPSLDHTCSYFYSLVSQDTHEIRTSYTRQSWLRDQGFAYRVLSADEVLKWYRFGGKEGPTVLNDNSQRSSTSFAFPRKANDAPVPPTAVSPAVQRPLCCIGRPRWWYSVRPVEYMLWKQQQQRQRRLHGASAPPTSGGQDEGVHSIRTYQRQHWAPFTASDSLRLQHYFNRGVERVLLKDGLPLIALQQQQHEQDQQQQQNGRLPGAEATPSPPFAVQFSSVDAPHTFGSVMLTSLMRVEKDGDSDADNESTEDKEEDNVGLRGGTAAGAAFKVIRRITCGTLDDDHCCLDKQQLECVRFALDAIQRRKKAFVWTGSQREVQNSTKTLSKLSLAVSMEQGLVIRETPELNIPELRCTFCPIAEKDESTFPQKFHKMNWYVLACDYIACKGLLSSLVSAFPQKFHKMNWYVLACDYIACKVGHDDDEKRFNVKKLADRHTQTCGSNGLPAASLSLSLFFFFTFLIPEYTLQWRDVPLLIALRGRVDERKKQQKSLKKHGKGTRVGLQLSLLRNGYTAWTSVLKMSAFNSAAVSARRSGAQGVGCSGGSGASPSPVVGKSANSDGALSSASCTPPQRQPPRATTVEEDIEEEIREENLYALDRAMETLTTNVTEMISDPRRMQKSLPLKDIKREETRRLREYQLKTITRRQAKAKRKFDLVEDMFQKALERRFRAHIKIAADPPADRLVGQSMVQYVPAAMLHAQKKQTELFMQVRTEVELGPPQTMVHGRIAPHLTHPVPLLALQDNPMGSNHNKDLGSTYTHSSNDKPNDDDDDSKTNAIVFLTEMDGRNAAKHLPQQEEEEGGGEPARRHLSPPAGPSGVAEEGSRSPSQAEVNHEIDENIRLEAAMPPAERRRKKRADLDKLYHVPPERLKEWEELGYKVFYVGHNDPICGSRLPKVKSSTGKVPAGGSPSPSSAVGASSSGDDAGGAGVERPPRYISSRERDRRSQATWLPECNWMQLAPLPPVCLLQRRLESEDARLEEMLAESRRYQRFKTSAAKQAEKEQKKKKEGGRWESTGSRGSAGRRGGGTGSRQHSASAPSTPAGGGVHPELVPDTLQSRRKRGSKQQSSGGAMGMTGPKHHWSSYGQPMLPQSEMASNMQRMLMGSMERTGVLCVGCLHRDALRPLSARPAYSANNEDEPKIAATTPPNCPRFLPSSYRNQTKHIIFNALMYAVESERDLALRGINKSMFRDDSPMHLLLFILLSLFLAERTLLFSSPGLFANPQKTRLNIVFVFLWGVASKRQKNNNNNRNNRNIYRTQST